MCFIGRCFISRKCTTVLHAQTGWTVYSLHKPLKIDHLKCKGQSEFERSNVERRVSCLHHPRPTFSYVTDNADFCKFTQHKAEGAARSGSSTRLCQMRSRSGYSTRLSQTWSRSGNSTRLRLTQSRSGNSTRLRLTQSRSGYSTRQNETNPSCHMPRNLQNSCLSVMSGD